MAIISIKPTSTPLPSSSFKKMDSASGKNCNGATTSSPITFKQLDTLSSEFSSNAKNTLAMRALSRESYAAALENREAMKITNQRSSGRCWLFAGLNVLRVKLMEKYNMENMEFSQTFLFFYDKIEKSNWFLQNIINTLDLDLDGREVQHLLNDPVQDGGQWDMFVSLVQKYGVAPLEAYPDTFHSMNSRQMDELITTKLRTFAKHIRSSFQANSDHSLVEDIRKNALAEIHKILCISLGVPPQGFDWRFYNKDKKYVEFCNLTPTSFYINHVESDTTQTVSLINDPRNEYYRLYTVKYLGNVVGGTPIRYINLPIGELKTLSSQVISDKKKAVWFGCHVGKFVNKGASVLDLEVIDYSSGFDINFDLNKAERLEYGDSMMTHAMVFTGVQIENQLPVRWRVENSWGKDSGSEGYITMSDDWYSEYVYQPKCVFRDNKTGQTSVFIRECACEKILTNRRQ
ncbi:hypothetical protein BB561_001909 [Smittium simulii]|uniref:Cysteine proteinase 1, mitochondrial n=1 Tax=Smittium simulii TaxID=133385 RepID=A0A2T9YSE9_9FUNG|nr:hypothetical protein BB561_001909 [Smittium simulii]